MLEYIRYINRHAIIEEFVPTESEQRLYDLVSEYLQRPNLYALPEAELDKLDRWGEDQRASLKETLKELEDQIKELRKAARLAPNLPEKHRLEREKRNLETRRDEAWRDYDQAAKEIEIKKDKLIDEVEKRMRQEISENRLFVIRWKVV